MHWSVSVLISNIQVGAFFNQSFYDGVVQTYDTEMEWTTKDATALIDVGTAFNQGLSCQIILLSNGKTKWCALIFVKHISVNLIHQESVNDARVSICCCLMQNRALSIVSRILIKSLLRKVLQKRNQSTLLHLILYEQTKHLH